ncbi:MAG: hypothetical protein M0P91_02110 [Sulfuricurvum sp.]|jgi:hypothetical protein|uniref:hypothetical protein n=1 Tax=Sulfuricurvum sp. TaxID=2025608 RepID=UPI0025F22D22|nr:hypothetical protein [Sulfuricurvum sp.]MCK9371963.1 hypothetical protein [Sulfuricurvum sp.]
MKKVALSALAAAMVSGVVYADSMTLYSDPKTGQVFTAPGENRIEMGDFVDAKTVDMADRDQESKFAEYLDGQKKYTKVKSKAKTIEFSGTHYFGLTSATPETTSATGDTSTGFELRRNYVQVKAYFNDKDYFRVTMDTTKELGSTSTTYANMFAKYAYLYLDDVLPYTGVEIGIAHRPWIDYEEHNSWHYRSFNKVFLEEKGTTTEAGVDLVNSADLGFNLKTKTDMFSSEIGMFNGEGYHADKVAKNQQNSKDLSLEWRLTAHLLGSGTKLGKNDRTKDTYANLSTYGLISKNHKDDNATIGDAKEYDRSFYGIHGVYNQPEFLIAAQYFKATDDVVLASASDSKYTGWSVNAEIRPMTDWTIIGRYDDYKKESESSTVTKITYEGTKKIVALAYKMNKNVSFIGSGKFINENNSAGIDDGQSKKVYMMTTEVKW